MTTSQQKAALLLLCDAFVDTVREAGELGAPSGVMYAAVMDKMTLDQFTAIMTALVAVGKVTKRGDCYFAGGRK